MHLLFLAMNGTVSVTLEWLRLLERPETKAVVIQASQKTLPVAIAVISVLPSSVGDEGIPRLATSARVCAYPLY